MSSDDDRLDRLEQRLALLETLVRKLAGQPEPVPTAPPRPSAVPSPTAASAFPEFSERWIGQRALLGIGVFALLMATGYLLKLSFERGWIPPLMRCAGGVALGTVVGSIGWRLHQRYRTYGAALIGCGAGIIYLSVWAACRLYQVIPSAAGVFGLALVSVGLAMIALAVNVEALGTAAALGAFMAPVLLGQETANANLLLLYLASMAAALGLVATQRRWRLTAFVVAASYFGVGTMGAAEDAVPWAVLLFGLIGGTAGLYVGLRERWWETRLLAFGGGWALLGAASERLGPHWPVFVAGVVLSLPVWRHALRHPLLLPEVGAPTGWSLGEAFYFFSTPVLLAWAAYDLAPDRFDRVPGLLALAVAVPYLVAGYARLRPAFALVGATAAAIAAGAQWEGLERVWALLGLALLWPALDHRLGRSDGRWYGLITLAAALEHLFDDALMQRTTADAAFVGPWPWGLWGAVAVTAAFAAGLWRMDADREDTRPVRPGLWIVAGGMALFGVTGEIRRYFELRGLSPDTASLAGGLAVSAWWLVSAAALVSFGFRRSFKQIRVAGLAVAGLAVIKVIVFDLSSLDALYRVGSVFLLGLVTLSLAYLYYRHDRGERTF